MSAPLPLTPERRRTLAAVVERILPGTGGVGAADAGVAAAFEGAMLDPFFRGLRPGIEMAIDALEQQAAALHQRPFADCTADEQDALLGGLERHPHPGMQFVFRSLVTLSLEGLLGDPVHGGNRNFQGWTAIGLEPADLRSGMCRGAGVEAAVGATAHARER